MQGHCLQIFLLSNFTTFSFPRFIVYNKSADLYCNNAHNYA